MATSKPRSEGFRAQVLEYIRKHPGISSTELRSKAGQFGTDDVRISKTVWAMQACGLIVHRRIDPTKKMGPVEYWVPEAAPAEMKAEVKLARQLQKNRTTTTEMRKQQPAETPKRVPRSGKASEPAEATEPKAVKATPAAKPAKTPKSTRSASTQVLPEQAAVTADTGPQRKKRGSYKKRAGSAETPEHAPEVAARTGPIVTPVSLEQPFSEQEQGSLFEEPGVRARHKRGRPAVASNVLAVAPSVAVAAPALDLSNMAAALQPFAGALSDMLANMVIGQTLQKVQQGLGGLSMALAQGAPQLPAAPSPASVSPLDAAVLLGALSQGIPTAAPQQSNTEATSEPRTEDTSKEAAVEPPPPEANNAESSAEGTHEPEGDSASEPSPPARRPVIHLTPVREKAPKKTKLLIVGLIPHQAGVVQSEFYEVFDIRFAEADTPAKRLESMAEDCERVIIMASFISHTTRDVVKKHRGFEELHGGVTKVRDRLTEIFIASEEAA